jgi:hypothetical protein
MTLNSKEVTCSPVSDPPDWFNDHHVSETSQAELGLFQHSTTCLFVGSLFKSAYFRIHSNESPAAAVTTGALPPGWARSRCFGRTPH